MFEHCIWYELREKHPIHLIIRRCARLFHTIPFPAHMTLYRNKSKREANHLWHIQLRRPKTWFFRRGPLYQTHEKDFYALQIDFTDFQHIYHISIAYRYGKSFTTLECLQASMLFNVDEITENDTFVSHHLCNTPNPNEWRRIR